MSKDLLPIGSKAPDFTLPATGDKRTITLSEFTGRPVVLVFYPADWSPICGDQLPVISEALDRVKDFDAELLAISVDSLWSHQAFAEAQQLRFPILADFEPKGRVSRLYKGYDDKSGTSLRTLYVIGDDGRIAWSHLSPNDVNPGLDGILGALARLQGREQETTPNRDRAELGHFRGPRDAKVTLVEYGDYQCPHCRQVKETVERLLQMFTWDLRFEFRNFPLSRVHPHAFMAAEAAEAAAAQGCFWEMHESIFAHQDALTREHLVNYAKDLDLDSDRVRQDLERRTWQSRVEADFQQGVQDGVSGTPTFFINGHKNSAGNSFEALSEAIQRALSERKPAAGEG